MGILCKQLVMILYLTQPHLLPPPAITANGLLQGTLMSSSASYCGHISQNKDVTSAAQTVGTEHVNHLWHS